MEKNSNALLVKNWILSITEVSRVLGVHITTIHRWFYEYEHGGLKNLLSRVIPENIEALLSKDKRKLNYNLNQNLADLKATKQSRFGCKKPIKLK